MNSSPDCPAVDVETPVLVSTEKEEATSNDLKCAKRWIFLLALLNLVLVGSFGLATYTVVRTTDMWVDSLQTFQTNILTVSQDLEGNFITVNRHLHKILAVGTDLLERDARYEEKLVMDTIQDYKHTLATKP